MGRKKRYHIKKTYYIEKEFLQKMCVVAGKTDSDKMNRILKEYFEFILNIC